MSDRFFWGEGEIWCFIHTNKTQDFANEVIPLLPFGFSIFHIFPLSPNAI